MTFTVPDNIADQLIRQVPARDRSRYVADAIATSLKAREQRLIAACEVANGNPDVLEIEREWDSLGDDADSMTEPWTDARPR
jgi:hypothetical protein